MKKFHLHLVSDSTGDTLISVARAVLPQFEKVSAEQHVWRMIRGESLITDVQEGIRNHPGFVLCTFANEDLAENLKSFCRDINVPCIDLLHPVTSSLSAYLGVASKTRAGGQYVMDSDYYDRIDAMHFVLAHDDGQSLHTINDADIILLGVSRTSKSPVCIYLANRGIRAANIPLVPGCPVSPEILNAEHPMMVGLTKNPRDLVMVRRNRLEMLGQNEETDYVDLSTVTHEVNEALKLFQSHNWPVIDVSRKSIEETAATILNMYNNRGGEE